MKPVLKCLECGSPLTDYHHKDCPVITGIPKEPTFVQRKEPCSHDYNARIVFGSASNDKHGLCMKHSCFQKATWHRLIHFMSLRDAAFVGYVSTCDEHKDSVGFLEE